MNVFVTGGTGFVGRNLVEFLLKQKNKKKELNISCLVRNPKKAVYMQEAGIRVVKGDLRNSASYEKEIQEADLVFHVAALVGLKNGPEFYEANQAGTAGLLEAIGVHHKNLKRLVFVSSIAAVDRSWEHDWTQFFNEPLDENSLICPRTDYGKSKRQAEEMIINSGLPYTIMRPAYIYGPHPRVNSSMDKVIYHVRDAVSYTRFPFSGIASEIYVEDLAEALWHVALHQGALNDTFFVANPEPKGVAQFFEAIAKGLGVDYSPRRVSEALMKRFKAYQFALNPSDPVVRILYTDYFHCSAEKLKKRTGYEPRIGFDEGLKKTVAWYREAGRL